MISYEDTGICIASFHPKGYDRLVQTELVGLGSEMVTTRQQALEIASKARETLEGIYRGRLRGVYLYGSAARDELTADSDIDIAVVLDDIPSRFAEHERTSQLAADLSLEYDTVVTFLFVSEADLADGTFLVYRTIKREGILA